MTYGTARTRKEQRQKEATSRQAAYNKLTLDEKIQLTNTRPGASKRELNRLMAKHKETA